MRTSRGWIDDKWLEVKGKKDIKSFINSSLSDVSKCSIKEPDKCEKQMLPSLWHLKTTKWRQLLNTQLRIKTLMCLN
uniref:Uncharacterized protein n=1 Tax=Solanum tuberosum TaxID=4113 RepID=M0ZXI9_SOLTU